MRKTITVTRGNIACGRPGHPDQCPIAMALIEAGMDAPIVDYDYDEALEVGPRPSIEADCKIWSVVPEDRDKVIEFIKKFDKRSILVRPFSFTMESAGESEGGI